MPRAFFAVPLLLLMATAWADAAWAEDAARPQITISDHRFSPAELHVPANQPVVIDVRNQDATAEEFESAELGAELFDGAGQELLDAAILLLAVLMLAWHVLWMASHGRDIARDLRQAGTDVTAGRRPVSALSVVVGVAVLREGFEIVLFLYGISIGGGAGWQSMLAGAAAGLVLAAGLTALTYAGLVRLPAHRLFAVTGWMVTLLACGLAAQAVGFLQQGGIVDVMGGTLWDTSAVLAVGSIAGRVVHTLVGYTDPPTGLQAVAYAGTLAAILVLSRLRPVSTARAASTGRSLPGSQTR